MAGEIDKSVSRRDVLKAGAALGVAVPSIGAFLAACGSSAPSAAPTTAASAAASAAATAAPSAEASAAPVSVNLYDTIPASTLEYWKNTLYPEFQKQYPGVTIVETNGGIEDPLKLRTLVAAGTAESPDMAWMETGEQGVYQEAGLLADIDTWLNGKADIKSDIFGALVTLSSYKGKVVSLPWMTNNTAMLVNVTAFKEAGVPIPSQDPESTWTWEEFEAACKAVTEKGTMKGYCMNQTVPGWDAWLAHAWMGTNGINDFMAEDGTANFAGPEGVEVMTFLQGLVQKGYTIPLTAGWEYSLWTDGKAAITTNGPWNFADYKKITAFEFTVVPYPRKKQPATNIGGNNLFIFNHPEKVDGCFKYAEYMLSTDFQVEFALESGNPPVTQSAVNHADYQKLLTEFPFLKGWVNQIPYGKARSSLAWANDARTAFGEKAWDPIIVKGEDVTASLKAAEEAVNALRE